ncbi:MAG: BtpA family membrane complex biogenesis protein [Candidatus Wallbacteria bacterium HGW-Wallbacteria-1]|jgi:hypothetical protein|uniref:BtpA family membrane complex biogenesis protein n=1 Tax=Candidatus Wallbacteria bacterium HGW-Wallbacteria-1 TaxID=2013854 RepID=A0A2N1PNZ9_9BACT|nr:MAG: BtpA family membrane complex biogenesis protein [Candidatus Wallbacteria bacterium HGW-Wallbacteria-1]
MNQSNSNSKNVRPVAGLIKPVIAMIHVPALPGTPKSILSMDQIIEATLLEAETYAKAGVDILMIENMHDVPYLNKSAGAEITAAMAIIGRNIRKAHSVPCGIQILAGANHQAMGAAKAAGLEFIRAEGFVFGHIGDEGYFDSCAGELLRYRKSIGADEICIFTDIKKKHSSHSITSDVDIVETARAAEFFLADGVIVTGASTGCEASLEEIRAVRSAVSIPVLVGSGVTAQNVATFLLETDALIVGSHFKKKGHWSNPIDAERVKAFMDSVRSLRDA